MEYLLIFSAGVICGYCFRKFSDQMKRENEAKRMENANREMDEYRNSQKDN